MSRSPASVAQELPLLPCTPEFQLPVLQVHQPPPNSGPELYSYKNKLQEHTQKLSLRFPVYETINEGSQHAPQFRSIVLVDNKYYKSAGVFPQRKLAEQNAARVALDDLSKKIKEDGRPLVCEDTTFCKSILHEYTDKMRIEKPKYHTVQQEGILPAFASVVKFNGVSYRGGIGKNKKEAEQLAARAAILSIIDSDSDGIICKIIKSKVKLYTALNKIKDIGSVAPPALCSGSGCDEFSNKKKDAEASGIDINLPLCGIDQSTSGEITVMQAVIESFPKFKKPRPEISTVEVATPIAFVPAGSQQPELPSASVQLPSTLIQLSSASGVKRSRKSKKKNKKRSLVDAQMPSAVLLPPCPVTQ